MDTVSLNYHCAPDAEPLTANAPYRPLVGTTVSVIRTINEEYLTLTQLIDELAEFIEAAGWVFPDGKWLGLVDG